MSLVFELRNNKDLLDNVDLKRLAALATSELEDSDVASLEDIGDYEDTEFGKSIKPHVFSESWLKSFPKAWKNDRVRKYLKSRRVSAETCEAFDVRFDPHQDRVCIPVRDDQGRLRGLHGRLLEKTDDPTVPVYRMYTYKKKNNPEIWLGEHLIDFDEPLVLVESVFDLLAVYPAYSNVAAALTASVQGPKTKRMADASEVIIMFDSDMAGERAASYISGVLRKAGARVSRIKLPEGTDPGDYTEEHLEDILRSRLDLY